MLFPTINRRGWVFTTLLCAISPNSGVKRPQYVVGTPFAYTVIIPNPPFKLTGMVNFLMIDDNPIEHIIMQKMFDKFHLFPNAVHSLDGRLSINLLAEHSSEADIIPDVIFLDLNMPGYSGWDFLYDFEKLHRQIKKTVDVYIISSSVDPKDKQLADKYDFVKTFVSKPIKTETLLDLHSLYQSDKRVAS